MPHPGRATRTSASRRIQILSDLRSALTYLDHCDDIDLSTWATIINDRDTAVRAAAQDAQQIRQIHATYDRKATTLMSAGTHRDTLRADLYATITQILTSSSYAEM